MPVHAAVCLLSQSLLNNHSSYCNNGTALFHRLAPHLPELAALSSCNSSLIMTPYALKVAALQEHVAFMQAGAEVCLTVTLLDGLVLARAGIYHSANSRSVMLLGKAEAVTDPGKAPGLGPI